MRSIAFIEAEAYGMGFRSGEMFRRISSLGPPMVRISSEDTLGILKHAFFTPRTWFSWPSRSALGLRVRLKANSVASELRRIQSSIGIIHAEGSFAGYAACGASEELGIPYVLDLHGLWGQEYDGEKGRGSTVTGTYLTELEELAVTQADHVVVVSGRMKDYIISAYRVSPNRVTVIPNGGYVNNKRASYCSRMTLVYGGIFSYWESVEDFVEMALCPDSRHFDFVLLGGGPRKGAVLRVLRKKKPSNFKYLGFRPRGYTLDAFSRSQVGVTPSTSDLVRQVAWPIKVMDYMSCGLPVIAPSIGDWAEVIADHEAGIVTRESSPTEFIEAALALRDKATWLRASRNAFSAIRDNYQWDQVLEPLESIYAPYV